MVLETQVIPFWNWLSAEIGPLGLTLLSLFGFALLLGFIASSFRNGPFEAARLTFNTIVTGVAELAQLSPRRIFAIARLSFMESIRRRVFIVLGIFVILLMFAGWFLDRESDHPARLYLNFVLTASNYLVIILAIFLSAFSIPNDVKHKTIYTVVTKPVRGWEIVFGRMLGFCTVGTLLLAIMWLSSLIFVWRGVRHEHVVDVKDLLVSTVDQDGEQVEQRKGESSLTRSHRHAVAISPSVVANPGDNISVDTKKDHTHQADMDNSGNVKLGRAYGELQARVPILGRLRFLDRDGRPGEGVNVGDIWKYRSFIEGGSGMAAIWRFENIDEDSFGEDGVLPIEMTIRVFRSYKGLIEKGLTGTIQIVLPSPIDEKGNILQRDGGIRSIPLSFQARDYEVHELGIPRKIAAVRADGTEFEADIYNDLTTPNGELEIWVQCLDRAQYFGMAPADLYLRSSNRPFWFNFTKGYFSIWFQMVVVTCFGVAFSTFLSGSVAMLATLSSMVIGFNRQSIFGVASGEIPGGGPLESLVRLITQQNQIIEFDKSLTTSIIQGIDTVLMHVIKGVGYAMPDCGEFNTSNFVAYGYDVPGDLVLQHFAIAMAYVVILTCFAYFFFKTREIAA